MLPFKILDFFIKPVSLSLRLFGNVFGAYILMEFIYIVVPMILPGLLGLWFDIADGILQGIIFTYLSITYIGEVIESAHESKHHKKNKLSQGETEGQGLDVIVSSPGRSPACFPFDFISKRRIYYGSRTYCYWCWTGYCPGCFWRRSGNRACFWQSIGSIGTSAGIAGKIQAMLMTAIIFMEATAIYALVVSLLLIFAF